MSLSHRNARRTIDADLEVVSKTIYICPECDKKRMRRVVSSCELGEGTVMPSLERFHCMACGSDFFDPPAMDAIQAFRESQKRKPVRASRSKKTGATVYSTAV